MEKMSVQLMLVNENCFGQLNSSDEIHVLLLVLQVHKGIECVGDA